MKPSAVVTSDDKASSQSEDFLKQPTFRVCRVCTREQAKYTCPKCFMPYCSVNCYRAHDLKCTESFYKAHVDQELKLRKNDKQDIKNIHEILQRTRENDTFASHDFVDMETPDGNHDEAEAEDEAEDELNDALEELVLQDQDNLDQMLSLLTEKQLKKFHLAIAQGDLVKQLKLAAWKPWWMESEQSYSEAVAMSKTEMFGDGNGDESRRGWSPDSVVPTVWCERHKLRPFLSTLSQETFAPSKVSSTLIYHIVNVVLNYCSLLRSYNGDISSDEPLVEDVYQTLVSRCRVLSDADVRFNCCVDAVLNDQAESFNQQTVDDAQLVLQSHLFTLDCLLDLYHFFSKLQGRKASSKRSKKQLALILNKLKFFILFTKNVLDAPKLQAMAAALHQYQLEHFAAS